MAAPLGAGGQAAQRAMNRYTATGVLADMRAGKHVLVLTESRSCIRDAMYRVIDTAGELEPGEKAMFTNGAESISGAGRIEFHSAWSNLRGMTPDVVVLDCDDHILGMQWYADLERIVGRDAEVIMR